MDEPEPNDRRRFWSRVFIVVFFGLAILISITTILATWRGLEESGEAPAAISSP